MFCLCSVQTESFYDARGRVYLELADTTPGEAELGMAVLKKLVGQRQVAPPA